MTRQAPRPDSRSILGTSVCRLLGGLLAAGLVLASAGTAGAGGYLDASDSPEIERPGWAVPSERVAVEGEGDDAMLARLQNAEMRLREAQQNAVAAEYAYTRARTRNYPRGDALQEIENRNAEMKKELVDAQAEFVALVEEARRAGVPAGTLMPYMDLADEVRRAGPNPAAAP